MAKILLIDDEQMMHVLFADVAAELGHDFEAAGSIAEGRAKAETGWYDVIFLDVLLPDGNGIDELISFKGLPSTPEIIVITSHGDLSGAASVLQQGGWEYLTKPLTVDKIVQSVRDVVTYRDHRSAIPIPSVRPTGIIGSSPQLIQCLSKIDEAARMDVTAMIFGETGTGKELFAKAVHKSSKRADKPFVTLDCASLSPTLIGSQLFGHVRGAFTGADRSSIGVIAQAHGGTLFMDEVGELPIDMQASFLRVLETGQYRPVGGQKENTSNFRLVVATNKDLEEMARLGLFRRDLLYRLRGISITLPPLRERMEDLEALTRHYIRKACAETGGCDKNISDEFWTTMRAYKWPGNVRELKHAVRRALAAAQDGPVIYSRHLPTSIRIKAAQQNLGETENSLQLDDTKPQNQEFSTLKAYRNKAEKEYIDMLLTKTKRNMSQAAGLAGISRGYLYELLKKHKVKR